MTRGLTGGPVGNARHQTRTVSPMTSTTLALTQPTRTGQAPLSVGVEEEFLLMDPAGRDTAPIAAAVAARLPADLQPQIRTELSPCMLELVTPVCHDLTELKTQLAFARKAAAVAATEVGASLLATGISPGRDTHRDASSDPRYREMASRYGALARDPAVCGGHVHVGVPDRETAVQVCNHLRPWLPVIQAISSNSALHDGVDTGHDSWRTVQLGRWPGSGPTPFFASAADYEYAVAQLVDTGVLMDEAMIYWYARLSARYPTVEIRVGDVCATVEETLLVAALTRGLVATLIEDVADGVPAPRVPSSMLRAAHWQAARNGLRASLIDLRLGRARPAWGLVQDLFDHVAPALRRHGDDELVGQLLTRLRRTGTGAARQRAAFGRTSRIEAVVRQIAAETTGHLAP